jgi:ubiquinone biosynthesis O-methyltransferase
MKNNHHNLIVNNPKFRHTLSVKKNDLKNRYKIVYKETFQTSVPGTAANIFYVSKSFLKNKKVLDLGCGAGRLSLFASTVAKHVTGIDYVPDAISYANSFSELTNRKNVHFKVGDLDKFSGQKFDIILISEVLQHVENPQRTLKQCQKLLNKNGYVIVSIPCFNNFRGNVWLTLQNLFHLPMSLTDTFQLAPQDMEIMSKKAGLHLEKIIGMSYDWAWAEWGIDDLKRRISLAIKDAKLQKISDIKLINKWLDQKLIENKQYLKYLQKSKILKLRPKLSPLHLPKNTKANIRKYLDDGSLDINRFYCSKEPHNTMGAGAIYFIKN